MYPPHLSLFISTLILGSLMALSSNNWVYVWMGLELNLLSFIPMISASSNLQETESAVKYFIIQTIGSGILMATALMTTNPFLFSLSPLFYSSLMCLSIALKLGVAPAHWWLPHVMSGMNWFNCMILATWQKIAPIMLIISSISHTNPIIILVMSVTSAMVGGIGGMNQTQMRTILAYSSIGHLAWMLLAVTYSTTTSAFYFSIYCVINIAIMALMMKLNQFKSALNFTMTNLPKSFFMPLALLLMSLGGLPPLLGFAPKWLVFLSSTELFMMAPLSFLIAGSLMNLFYYLNMLFNFSMHQNKAWFYNHVHSPIIPSMLTVLSGPLFMIMVM